MTPLFDELAIFFDASNAALVLPADEGYRLAYLWGPPGEAAEAVERQAADALAGRTEARPGMAAAAMLAGVRNVGAVAVAAAPEHLDAEGRLALETWSAIVSLRVRQLDIEEQYRRLESIAETDQLTGIANRRAFDAHARREWEAWRRTAERLSIAIFDIDFFKVYNDRYGHIAGDAALRRVAAAIRGCAHRARDLAARFGGEEFVAVMPQTTEHDAIAIAERMRAAVLDLKIPHAGSGLGVVTVSVGVAACSESDIDATDLLARADSALYVAKEAGRNRVAADGYVSESQAVVRTEAGVHGLPAAGGTFVGRRDELGRLSDALARGRLVTLAGTGGAGKTRLAAQVSGAVAKRYRDGVWYVDVSSARDGGNVVGRIANAMAIAQHDLSPADAVVERLRAQHLLLIVDGCEHAIDGVRETADMLLRSTERLYLLAVTRETLNLPGESVVRLAGLNPPDAHALFGELLGETPAAASLTDEALVESVCRQIGYLPLGIELFVRQLAPMSLRQLQLLVAGRIAPLRKLDDVIAWSVGLLGERMRRTFLALCVFAGGFDGEAARAVAGVEPAELEAFESRSLLSAGAGEVARYAMLDVVADFARRTLTPGTLETLRERHFEYFRAVAREAAHASLDLERENLDAALVFAKEGGRREDLLLMASALAPFWLRRGHLNAGLAWLVAALARTEPANDSTIANASRYAGMIARRLGDFTAARDFNERALHIWRNLENVNGVGSALNGLALVAHTAGEFDRAQLLYEESMKHSERLDDALGTAMAINNLGGLAMYRGDYAKAGSLIGEAVERAAKLNDAALEALAVNNLSEVRFLEGRYDEAIALARRSLESRRQIGDRPGLTASWIDLANALLSAGRAEEAWQPVREALLLVHEIGDRRGFAMALLSTARLLQAHGRREEAMQMTRNADAIFRRSNAPLFGAERAVRDALDIEPVSDAPAGGAGFEAAFEEALATFR